MLVYPSDELAEDEGYRLRFWAEATNSGRLNHGCVAPVVGMSAPNERYPWILHGAFPALSLDEALVAAGGRLPVSLVSGLALALADALFYVHSHGLVYAGLSPESVLLTPSGPQLTGFGLVRAASPEGTERGAVPGVPPGSLPPEQLSGERPLPAGDVYALGAVLLHASSGCLPDSGVSPSELDLPSWLGELIEECLVTDPLQRPRADTLVQRLRSSGAGPDFQLPHALAESLNRQAARAHAVALAEADALPLVGSAPETIVPTDRIGIRQVLSRRAVLVGIAGATGSALGIGGVLGWRASEEEPKRAKRLRTAGTGPSPLWRYEPDGGELGLWDLTGSHTAVFTRAAGLAALNLRSGDEIWARGDLGASVPPLHAGKGKALISDLNEFHLISTRTGQVRWTEKGFGTQEKLVYQTLITAGRGVFYFLAEAQDAKNDGDRFAVVAYRVGARKEMWRQKIPPSFANAFPGPEQSPPVLHDGMLLLPNVSLEADEEWFTYLALDARTGKHLWTRTYSGARPGALGLRQLVPGNQLISGVGAGIRAYDLRSGKKRWDLETGVVANRSAVRGSTIFFSDADLGIHAVDVRNGERRWHESRAAAPYPGGVGAGETVLSESGKTLLRSSDQEIVALRTSDGTPLWRMAMVGTDTTSGSGSIAGSVPGVALLVTESLMYALPVD